MCPTSLPTVGASGSLPVYLQHFRGTRSKRGAPGRACLGAAEEWQTWQLQDGREFYVKPSTNDKRWIRPVDAVDAVEENEALIKNCTST